MSYAEQLARADDELLERMETALLGLMGEARRFDDVLAKADDSEDMDLNPEDAQIMGTYFSIYSSAVEKVGILNAKGKLDAITRQSLQAEAEAQISEGMKLLSNSAKNRLQPILQQVNTDMAQFWSQGINPLQAATKLQGALDWVETVDGLGYNPSGYKPYEWARLCRTEAQFATASVQVAEYLAGGASDAIVRALGAISPIHPNCMCVMRVIEHNEIHHLVLMPAPTACLTCLNLANRVMDAVLDDVVTPEKITTDSIAAVGQAFAWPDLAGSPKIQEYNSMKDWKAAWATQDKYGEVGRGFYDSVTHTIHMPGLRLFVREFGGVDVYQHAVTHEAMHGTKWAKNLEWIVSPEWREALVEFKTRKLLRGTTAGKVTDVNISRLTALRDIVRIAVRNDNPTIFIEDKISSRIEELISSVIYDVGSFEENTNLLMRQYAAALPGKELPYFIIEENAIGSWTYTGFETWAKHAAKYQTQDIN